MPSRTRKYRESSSRASLEKEVAALVEEVTDDKSLEKRQRKLKQVETTHKKSDDAKRIKLADKTSNLRAITFSPPPDWSVKRRLEYINWAREVVSGLRGVSRFLENTFDRAVADAERKDGYQGPAVHAATVVPLPGIRC